ncbi:AmmeMemoRadiSam system protein A [Candidatus Woesearchaeota archaeon]|nr:AmmeMemoRadiSam system protein A [Candidatus Woesearchaeota archaeon]
MADSLPAAARKAVEGVLNGRQYDFKELERQFPSKAGVFVQVLYKGEPRGSVGFPEPVHSIGKATVLAAKAAAFEDPRFTPVKKEMLADCRFEVSILSKLSEVKGPRKELPGKIGKGQGIMIRFGPSEGVLLPGELEEFKPEEALDAACEKAGLAPETRKDENAKIYTFTVRTLTE